MFQNDFYSLSKKSVDQIGELSFVLQQDNAMGFWRWESSTLAACLAETPLDWLYCLLSGDLFVQLGVGWRGTRCILMILY